MHRVSVLAVLFFANAAVAMEGYYQSPSLRGDTVVFTAEGDLWLYRLGSEQAERLTTHPSLESGASISPDGSHVAFVSDYEGVSEAYLIPISGGVPKRLTYENASVAVHGWDSNGLLLYSTDSRAGFPYNFTLKTLNPNTLETVAIPLADANDGVIDARGQYVYFTQFGLRWSGDNASTYRGGLRGKLWRYRLDSNDEAVKLAEEHAGSARRLMTEGDKLYFLSDASGRDNLWSVDLDGANATQLTHHDEFSIRYASIDNGRAVYQLGADLHLLDLTTLASSKLDIHLTSDHPGLRENWINEPMEFVTSTRLSGDGKKVAITSRGKVAIAGLDQERLVNVGSPQDSRMRKAALSRDGKWIYAISDASGELELWRYDASGAMRGEQLTKGSNTQRRNFFESPDSKWIVHDDGYDGLWLLNTQTLENTQVVRDSYIGSGFGKLRWSPDSNYFAVATRGKEDARPRILLHSIDDGQQAYLTSDKFESRAPIFSKDGQWLYYLSDRHFDASGSSVWKDRDFGPSFDKRTEVFAHALTEQPHFPFQLPDELSPDSEEAEENDDSVVPKTEVTWDGLLSRVWQVPVEAGNYRDLEINEEHLYLLSTQDAANELMVIKLDSQAELTLFTDNVVALELSDAGTDLLVVKSVDDEMSMFIVPAEAEFPEDTSKHTVQTQGWQFSVDPRAEWQQMFHDAWLMHREQFYDPAMRGLDWDAIKEKYSPMLSRVTERRELNDVLAQMMGELNALHSAVRGGDVATDPNAPGPSILGAELAQTSRGVEIRHIYYHDPEIPAEAPPLAMPGVDAANGDIIAAINGVAVATLEQVHRALRNQAGKQSLLSLERGREEIRTVVVPAEVDEDWYFRYRDWTNNNRRKVTGVDSDIGYIHITDMGGSDAAAFAKNFYTIDKKKGVVIDVRRNGGGNVDSWIIDRLIRKAWMFWAYRTDAPYANMQNAYRGHLVVLADQGTYSDGETFTAAIKALNIAPVIGKRTAGAGVWLSGRNSLSDSGIARVAEFPVYAMDGRWIVEGRGVDPTIEVDNLPHATFMGDDAQLDAAIDYLKQKIAEEPVPEMKPRPFPEHGEAADDVTLLPEAGQ